MVKHIVAASMLCATLSACVAGKPDRLYAGTAKVDITPDRAVISAADGESFRLPDNLPAGEKTPPDNVHDPLYARVLVLKNNHVSLAVVSVDLAFLSSKRVIDEAKKQWGLNHVILSATHTHSGMVPRGLCPTARGWGWCFAQADPGESLDWPGFSEDPWYAATEEKVIAAIGEATRNLFPARIASGQSRFESEYMAHNRRLVNSDGTVSMLWSNPDRIATKPLDPTVRVIRVDDEAGQPRALMVHYACHPVILMGAGWVSRDFPGAAVDYIEGKLGDSCMAMFLQGALGDIDPYETSLRGEQGFNMVRQAGISLGEAALRVAQGLPASRQDTRVSMRVKESMVKIPHRTENKFSDACVITVVINDDLALVTIPGAPFVQHQLNLSEKSPVPNTLMLGVAYCGQGSPFLVYIPTVQAAKEGGRGATECCFVSADAGDRMVNAAVASINELVAK